MADAKLLKELQIKTGVLKRYVKEFHYYEKEAQKHADKIHAMKQDPATDEYSIKKFNEVLQETRSMIPITGANVKKSCDQLKELIEANAEALENSEQLVTARREIASAIGIQ